jgi:collagenase-like PrtC family protease
MLFSYLNLPQVPEFLEKLCLNNINLIDNHDELDRLNKLEGVGHSITFIPSIVQVWLKNNILIPNFDPVPAEMLTQTMLHVSHYIKHHEGVGVHPTHFDYGRNYAINYIIDPGGDDVVTYWTEDDRHTVIKEIKIEPRRWHVLKVKPDWHGVKGIRIGRLRSIISICLSPSDLESFQPTDYFKSLIV